MPVPLVPAAGDAAGRCVRREGYARMSVPPPVPKNVNPPPRPLPARLMPLPPVAKFAADRGVADDERGQAGREDRPAFGAAARLAGGQGLAAGGGVEAEGAVADRQVPGARGDRAAPGIGRRAVRVVDADRRAFLDDAVGDGQRAVAQEDAAAGARRRHAAGGDRAPARGRSAGRGGAASPIGAVGGRADLEQAEVRRPGRVVAR